MTALTWQLFDKLRAAVEQLEKAEQRAAATSHCRVCGRADTLAVEQAERMVLSLARKVARAG